MHVHNFTHFIITLERSQYFIVVKKCIIFFSLENYWLFHLIRPLFLGWDRVEPFEAALNLQFGASKKNPVIFIFLTKERKTPDILDDMGV